MRSTWMHGVSCGLVLAWSVLAWSPGAARADDSFSADCGAEACESAACDAEACDVPAEDDCSSAAACGGAGCDAAADGGCDCASCVEECCPDPWVVSREPLCDCCCLDDLDAHFECCRKDCLVPISGGAWHWWHQSVNGASGGYGIPGLRDTYFWYLNADPVFDIGDGAQVGGHLELRLRETDTFRSFIANQVWPWEAYGYLKGEHGTLKAGLLYKRFGLFWDGVFFGNAPYFDGMKLDADYGVSWESTYEATKCFKVERYCQFFFGEDQSNGSFGGADAESVPGYQERNTAVARVVPTWTLSDGSTVALGASGLVGQIESDRADLTDETASAYALDVQYTHGPWLLFVEGSQRFGVWNPVRYVSGGPSDRVTNLWTGVHYTHGAVTYRCSYSNSLDANPDGRQNMIVGGATIAISKNVDCYLEYVNQRIDGNANPANDGFVFHSFEYVINWHF